MVEDRQIDGQRDHGQPAVNEASVLELWITRPHGVSMIRRIRVFSRPFFVFGRKKSRFALSDAGDVSRRLRIGEFCEFVNNFRKTFLSVPENCAKKKMR